MTRLTLIASLALLLLLTACGDSSATPSGSESSPLAVVSAPAVATVAPATNVPVAVAPHDPYAAATWRAV